MVVLAVCHGGAWKLCFLGTIEIEVQRDRLGSGLNFGLERERVRI